MEIKNVTTVFFFPTLLVGILIILKLGEFLNIDWIVVFAPYLFYLAVVAVPLTFTLIALIIIAIVIVLVGILALIGWVFTLILG
jgi:hypothetical protein